MYNSKAYYEKEKWEAEKVKQEAQFVKNANEQFKNKNLTIVGIRPKIKKDYCMAWLGNFSQINKLQKYEQKVLFFLLDNMHFLNVVPINKVEIQKTLEIKDKSNFQKIYKKLIQLNFLINTNFSRKYLVVSPDFCFRGGKSELDNISKIHHKIIKIDEKYEKNRKGYSDFDIQKIEKLELELKRIFDLQYQKILQISEDSEGQDKTKKMENENEYVDPY